jgi:hypothetical protein
MLKKGQNKIITLSYTSMLGLSAEMGPTYDLHSPSQHTFCFIFSVPTIERQLVLGEKEAMRARSGGLGTKCMLTPTQISRAKFTQFMGHLQMKE